MHKLYTVAIILAALIATLLFAGCQGGIEHEIDYGPHDPEIIGATYSDSKRVNVMFLPFLYNSVTAKVYTTNAQGSTVNLSIGSGSVDTTGKDYAVMAFTINSPVLPNVIYYLNVTVKATYEVEDQDGYIHHVQKTAVRTFQLLNNQLTPVSRSAGSDQTSAVEGQSETMQSSQQEFEIVIENPEHPVIPIRRVPTGY